MGFGKMAEKKVILALTAHPDDAEIRAGGTLTLLAQRGWEIHIATCSSGDCGSAEMSPGAIAATRRKEAQAAAARLGGKYHCLGGKDLQIYDDNEMRAAATAVIREVDPDCMIAHYPIDYMADHTAASAVVRTALFVASMANYVVGSSAAVPPSTKGVVPLYYLSPVESSDFFGNYIVPQFCVDTSSVICEKAELLACHASQRDWLLRHHGIDHYVEQTKKWDAELGAKVGVAYAEGFFMHKGHGYPQTPIIQEALKGLIRKGK
jgi:LmbE family N-acetylglucosaminyl deacetylase